MRTPSLGLSGAAIAVCLGAFAFVAQAQDESAGPTSQPAGTQTATSPADAAQAATSSRPAAPVQADRTEELPPELQGVGIDEHLNTELPLDLEFTDQDGRKVKLRDYFDGKHPVILTLNYYKCPMLCTLQLNALVAALKELDWTAGEQFKIVTASFNPVETYHLATVKRQNYLAEYGRPQAAGGWAFLTGRKTSIDPLLETTGFHVKYSEQRQEWIHAVALILCTPDGRISRYLRNVAYDPKTLRLSLVEASDGKIGTTMDKLLLFCCNFDPADGSYSLAAWNIARGGALLTMLIVAGLLTVLWRRDRHRKAVTLIP